MKRVFLISASLLLIIVSCTPDELLKKNETQKQIYEVDPATVKPPTHG